MPGKRGDLRRGTIAPVVEKNAVDRRHFARTFASGVFTSFTCDGEATVRRVVLRCKLLINRGFMSVNVDPIK